MCDNKIIHHESDGANSLFDVFEEFLIEIKDQVSRKSILTEVSIFS